MNNNKETSFEEAYARLEEILENMNTGTVSLKKSLELYEEASKLINLCSSQLDQAEKKVEVLLKDKDGNLCLSEKGIPQTELFPEMSEG